MAKVGIVTDTVNCLPDELIREYGIKEVSVVLVIEGKAHRDKVDISLDEILRRLPHLEAIPTTDAPPPGDFMTAFEELAASGCDAVVAVLVSKVLSGTNQSAQVGKQEFLEKHPDFRVEIIDSKTGAGAEGFLVLEAARAAAAGKSADEVIAVVEAMLPRVTYITALNTMKYLIKGGRAPKLAVIGDVLNVKPMISNNKETGMVDNVGRERGKKKAMLKMVDLVSEMADTTKPLHAMVHYTDSIADAEELKRLLSERYECKELFMTPYAAVMSCHTGPVISLSFYAE
jgi:DegV family protein with EDD domain